MGRSESQILVHCARVDDTTVLQQPDDMVGDDETGPTQRSQRRVEQASWEWLGSSTAKAEQPGQVHLALTRDVEGSRHRIVDGVLDHRYRIAFVGELESRIEPEQGRDHREGEVAADRVPHPRPEHRSKPERRELHIGKPGGKTLTLKGWQTMYWANAPQT